MKKQTVPEPPKEKVVIDHEDLARLEQWIVHIKEISPRLDLVRPRDNEFRGLLPQVQRRMRREKMIEDDYEIIGWPTEDEVAFVVTIDSRPADSIVCNVTLSDTFIFCFGDRAFSLNHFAWDGDAEAGDWSKSYSLSSYSDSLLKWEFILSLIVKHVMDYEKRVPPIPSPEV